MQDGYGVIRKCVRCFAKRRTEYADWRRLQKIRTACGSNGKTGGSRYEFKYHFSGFEPASVLHTGRPTYFRKAGTGLEETYLPRPDKILFVVTKDTGKYCENIKEVLKENCAISDEEMGQLISQLTLDNGRDMEEIESRLSEEIRRIKGHAAMKACIFS